MGHDKLRKFAENETFSCLLQPDASAVLDKSGDPSLGLRLNDHPVKGHWNSTMFKKDQPIVLELGCGKGEYTIDLSKRVPGNNYIGVDIKGARLWRGAKTATEENLTNVAFLRTRIEFIEAFFGPGEVSEIWLTFSDPQLKSENSRLTSPLFLERYRKFLKPGGVIHLKTDSRFLHEYSKAVAIENNLTILAASEEVSSRSTSASRTPPPDSPAVPPLTWPRVATVAGGTPPPDGCVSALFEVQTFYEKMFLAQGYKITYLEFIIDHEGPYKHPSDFDSDYWRSIEGPRRFSHSPSSSQR